MLVLVALLRFSAFGAPLEQDGYATLASFDLGPVTDSAPVDVTTDAAGNVYMLGDTRSPPPGASRLGVGGAVDVVVAKYSSAGDIIYTTVLGGEGDDYASRIFVDAQGHVFLSGSTTSTNFPLRNALHSIPGIYQSVFLCRIAPDGGSFVYSTFRDGNLLLYGQVVVLPNGHVILAGSTQDASYDADAVVMKLDEFGTNILFSTVLGGMSTDQTTGAALDPTGAIWIAGRTSSPDFPVTPDAAQPYLKLSEESSYIYEADAFLVKLNTNGAVLYSTFWGTEQDDWLATMAFRADGTLFVTRSFPSAYGLQAQQIYPSGSDSPFQPPLPPLSYESRLFITQLNPYTGQIISEAVLPTGGYNYVDEFAFDSAGNVHFSGFLAGPEYLAQLDPAQSSFPRFATFDDCVPTAISGPVVGPTGELWLIGARFTATGTESTLYKLAPTLSPPANRRPVVSIDPFFGFGVPAFPRLEPEPPTITPVAADTDGTIRQVDLFANNALLAVLTNSPYSFAWSNAPYGEHTLIAVATDNLGLSSTSCPSSITVHAPPPNDSFYRSIFVSGPTFTVSGTTAGATREPGEPDRQFGYESSSVWWCWRAPANGTFSLDLGSAATSHTLTVFRGLDLTRLQSLGSGGKVAFQAEAGKAYYIRVVGTGFRITDYGLEFGSYVLSLQPVTPPSNDNFADRLLLSGVPLTLQAHNFNATYEPSLSVSGGDDYSSVWWTWTAPTSGVYRAVTISTNPYAPSLQITSTNTSGIFPPSFGSSTSVVWRAAAGEDFNIRVSGLQIGFELQLQSVAPPPNDDFADAITLSGLPVTITGTLLGATRETNEPVHGTSGPLSSSSVWYKWTPPSNAPVVIEVDSDSNGALLAVYSSHSPPVRTSGSDEPVQFFAVSGYEHLIVVDSPWAGTGDFSLTIRRQQYPPNDNFDRRIPVTAGGYGSSAEATSEWIEHNHLASEETETIWYSWFAPADGDYTLVTHSSGFDGRAAIFRLGESGNLVHVAGRSNVNSRLLQFTATAGTEYQIAFISRQNEGGNLAFRIRPSNAPANDDYANAAILSGASVYVEGSNVDATIEPGELVPTAYDTFGASVWWKWTAPHSGLFVVSLARHTMSASLAIWRGTELSSRIAVLPLYALSGSSLLQVTAGEEYRIGVYGVFSVYGWFEQEGDFTLAITPIQPPPNDDFANATVIHSSPVEATGTTLGATAEGTESSPSVWWRWTAPASQITSLKLSIDRPLEVFTGASLDTLARIAGSSNWYGPSSLFFNAQAGTTYHIRVSQYAFAPFTLTLKGPAIIEQPTISGLSHAANGSIQFVIDALIGSTNIIEASTDLLNWSPISTNLTDCFPYPFTAPPSAQPHQFYRARLIPHESSFGDPRGFPPRPGRLPQ